MSDFRNCMQCGDLFEATRPWHHYCSAKCRTKHWRSPLKGVFITSEELAILLQNPANRKVLSRLHQEAENAHVTHSSNDRLSPESPQKAEIL